MCKNRARIAHIEALDADADDPMDGGDSLFDMAAVSLPGFPRKPHAVSEDYRRFVSRFRHALPPSRSSY